jgi:hypothetical protein
VAKPQAARRSAARGQPERGVRYADAAETAASIQANDHFLEHLLCGAHGGAPECRSDTDLATVRLRRRGAASRQRAVSRTLLMMAQRTLAGGS